MISNLQGERLLLTLWVGSLLAIGYLAVPMAFATLGDVSLAGNYAGRLFSAVNILGLGCGIILLISKFISLGMKVTTLWRFWVLVVMITSTLIFIFYLQPEVAAVKQLMPQGNIAVLEHFDLFHKISKNLYIFISLLGVALVVSTDKAIV